MIGNEWPFSWELPKQISLECDCFYADLRKVFNETRRSYYIALTQASFDNTKSYFTSKLIEHDKNKQKNQDIKNTFAIQVASSRILIQLHAVCLTFEILFTTILHFFNI